MPANKRFSWVLYIAIALVAGVFWIVFTYPQLSFIKLSVGRKAALAVADDFLRARGIDTGPYKKSAVFRQNNSTILFLQRTIGLEGIQTYTEKFGVDIFFWSVRYFQPKQKEEFRVVVDSADGKVISFSHTIDSGTAKPDIEKGAALLAAENFLGGQIGFVPGGYSLKHDELRKFDHRNEYNFVWEMNDSRLVWDPQKESAKVVVRATVTGGGEILAFEKNSLAIPNEFFRIIEAMKNLGNNLAAVVLPFKLLLLVAVMYYVLRGISHLVLNVSRKFYIGIGFFSLLISLIGIMNFYPELLNDYNTTVDELSFYWQTSIQLAVSALFVAFITIVPGMAGEALAFERAPEKIEIGFMGYLRATFLNRRLSAEIGIGYISGISLLGAQAVLFEIGRRFCGVWWEYTWLTQLTSVYVPFLAIFAFAFKASIGEEFLYRMFGINWGWKIFRSVIVSCLVFSLLWGMGHSTYAVYPMWFRSLEVALLGLVLCFVYLRHGIVAVLVAHYFFDAFWMSAAYLFGRTNVYFIGTALLVLSVPAVIGVLAWVFHRVVEIRPLKILLNSHQKFNATVLRDYFQTHPEWVQTKDVAIIKKEIIGHGWDAAVVETVLNEMQPRNMNNKI